MSVGGVERVQERASWSWETRPGEAQKLLGHAEHVYGHMAMRCTRQWLETRRDVSIRLLDPELPDSPTGSSRQYADLSSELESHAYGMWMA